MNLQIRPPNACASTSNGVSHPSACQITQPRRDLSEVCARSVFGVNLMATAFRARCLVSVLNSFKGFSTTESKKIFGASNPKFAATGFRWASEC